MIIFSACNLLDYFGINFLLPGTAKHTAFFLIIYKFIKGKETFSGSLGRATCYCLNKAVVNVI